jgi:hypothetical protein
MDKAELVRRFVAGERSAPRVREELWLSAEEYAAHEHITVNAAYQRYCRDPRRGKRGSIACKSPTGFLWFANFEEWRQRRIERQRAQGLEIRRRAAAVRQQRAFERHEKGVLDAVLALVPVDAYDVRTLLAIQVLYGSN